MNRTVGTLLAAALLTGCAAGSGTGSVDSPAHPLVDQVVEGQDASPVQHAALFQRMADADVVYLGEVHDNPAHHALQRRVLEELHARGRRPILGLEMLTVDQTSLAMRYVTAKAATPHGPDPESALRAALGWDEGGSEYQWVAYGPLLSFAREHGLTAFGADLPVALRRRIGAVGVAALTGVERALIPDAPVPDPAYASLMTARIRDSHCGHGSADQLARLLENWVARNETIARAIASMLESANGDGPVVLVVGAGHTRHGLGIPPRVARLRPGVKQVNLGLRAVDPARTQASDYTAPLVHDGQRFDPDHPLLWFTPRSPESGEDPCAVFKRAPPPVSG